MKSVLPNTGRATPTGPSKPDLSAPPPPPPSRLMLSQRFGLGYRSDNTIKDPPSSIVVLCIQGVGVYKVFRNQRRSLSHVSARAEMSKSLESWTRYCDAESPDRFSPVVLFFRLAELKRTVNSHSRTRFVTQRRNPPSRNMILVQLPFFFST